MEIDTESCRLISLEDYNEYKKLRKLFPDMVKKVNEADKVIMEYKDIPIADNFGDNWYKALDYLVKYNLVDNPVEYGEKPKLGVCITTIPPCYELVDKE